jgi:dynactin-5
MYNPEVNFIEEDYIQTSAGNIICRSSLICKPQVRQNLFESFLSLELLFCSKAVEIPNGRCIIEKDAIIRGDLAAIQLNKYVYIGQRSVVRPAFTTLTTKGISSPSFRFVPLIIGSHTFIGDDCVIEAAMVGAGCHIEAGCVLSKRCILKDFVFVTENSVIPPGRHPFSSFSNTFFH